MNLKHVEDLTLLNDTKNLVRREQNLTADILWHLKEIDERKLYSEAKCGSLFEYCVKVLGYSEGSAQRRVVAARALKQMPQLAEHIASGDLTLTNLALIEGEFKNSPVAEKEKLFKEACGKTKKQTEDMIGDIKQRPKTFTVTMTEETFQLWQEMQQLSVDLKKVVETAKKTKLNSALKKEVFNRDQKCQQCGSRHHLEFDHRQPKALGGVDTKENLRLLCRNCNQRKRISAGLHRREETKHYQKSLNPAFVSAACNVMRGKPTMAS